LIGHCDLNQVAVDCGLVVFSVRAIQEKVKYLDRKYEIEIDDESQFFIEDYSDFIRKKAFANKKPPGGKEGKAQGLYQMVKPRF
jgi:hypothetical protein